MNDGYRFHCISFWRLALCLGIEGRVALMWTLLVRSSKDARIDQKWVLYTRMNFKYHCSRQVKQNMALGQSMVVTSVQSHIL